MTDAATTPDPATIFARGGGRNRFTARAAEVVAVGAPVAEFVRVTLTGPDFDDFTSTGPSDHVRTFFPDPATGELIAPVAQGPGEDGIIRPDVATIARDFTPLNVRREGGRVLVDLDILRHPDPGPAAAWGMRAVVGDRLVLVGPRGSREATQHAPRVLLVVDPTAFPAAGRWLAEVPASTRVDVIADVGGDLGWVGDYLRTFSPRDVSITAGGDDLARAAEAVGIDDGTYVFAAGEASRLVPLRRHLRGGLALPREQYAISGYWRHGVVAFDHHAPIDPTDPD
jgi:NADPH-dependent ferric siderophore reductase